MKTTIQLAICVLFAVALTGCSGWAWVNTPKGLSLQPPSARPAAASASDDVGQQGVAGANLEDMSGEKAVVPQGPNVLSVMSHAGTCGSGRTLRVRNETNNGFLEVRHADIQVCDGDGLVPLAVQQTNGGVRTALLIPPGASATYVFLPLRQVGGYPISTNGRKEYTVDVYDASFVLAGQSRATPAMHVTTIRHFLPIPYTCDFPGCIRTDTVTPFQVRWAKL